MRADILMLKDCVYLLRKNQLLNDALLLWLIDSSSALSLSGIANTTLGPSVGPSRTGREKKDNPSHTITNFYVTMNYNNMPSKRYKVVNPYAICHKMKKNYGWTGHDKWQRCVDKIKAKSKKR
jgi:hypothetical protein